MRDDDGVQYAALLGGYWLEPCLLTEVPRIARRGAAGYAGGRWVARCVLVGVAAVMVIAAVAVTLLE